MSTISAFEQAARLVDQFAIDAEKKAADATDGMVHDAMLMASDYCELLAGEIRALNPPPITQARWLGDTNILPEGVGVEIMAVDANDPCRKACWIRYWPAGGLHPVYRSADLSELELTAENPSPGSHVVGVDRLVELMDEGHAGGLQCPAGVDAASWGAGVNSGWDAAIQAVIALSATATEGE